MADTDDTALPARRRFLAAAALVATAPLLLRAADARAAGLPPLTTANAQAKALGYVAGASPATTTARKPGSTCANCQFFQSGSNGCALFAGFAVSPKGWCTAWAKRA